MFILVHSKRYPWRYLVNTDLIQTISQNIETQQVVVTGPDSLEIEVEEAFEQIERMLSWKKETF